MIATEKTFWPGLSVALLAALVWMSYFEGKASRTLQAELTLATKGRADALARIAEKERQIAELKKSLADSVSAQTVARPAESDERFENAIDQWLGRVHRLSAYLDQHPEKRIPQMDLLTADDWLDVTRQKLDTEADVRAAIGRLRGFARAKIAHEIGKALGQAIAAGDGHVPVDPQALAPYLPSNISPIVLQQLSINLSGKIEGLRTTDQFYLVDTPIDLWDSTLFYSANGTYGTRAAHAQGQSSVEAAIASFTKSNGSPPTDARQLIQYPGIGVIPEATLNDLFNALTTKVSPSA